MSKTYLMNKLSGTEGQYAVFQSDGSIASQTLDAGVKPQIHIYSTKSMTSVTVNGTAATGSGTDWVYNCSDYGTFEISASDGSMTKTASVVVDTVKRYDKEIKFAAVPEGDTLEQCSWENIRQICDEGNAASYWSIGDVKSVKMNGTLSSGLTVSNQTFYVFIIGFDHDLSTEYSEGHTITFNGFLSAASGGVVTALVDSGYGSRKTSGTWFNMKNSSSNSDGWGSSNCIMRVNIMDNIYKSFVTTVSGNEKFNPKTYIKPVTKKYIKTYNSASSLTTIDNQYIWLLAESEIFGGTSWAITSEGSQYTWFSNKGISTSSYSNNIRYRHSSTSSTCFWWERSPRYNSSFGFCCVDNDGSANDSLASYSYGVAPAFCV